MRHPNGTPLWICIGAIPPAWIASYLQEKGLDAFAIAFIAGLWGFAIGYIFVRATAKDSVIGEELGKDK